MIVPRKNIKNISPLTGTIVSIRRKTIAVTGRTEPSDSLIFSIRFFCKKFTLSLIYYDIIISQTAGAFKAKSAKASVSSKKITARKNIENAAKILWFIKGFCILIFIVSVFTTFIVTVIWHSNSRKQDKDKQ
jgi:hypothetical protein